jgi:sulfite reductase (ferredoxin)
MSQVESINRPKIATHPIPSVIQEEIETFEAEALRTLAGDISTDRFKPFRLQYGIYGQRQPGVQMVRVKIPFGGLTANQLRRLAELADRYATGVGHVTTRQDIQIHFVELKDVPAIMRGLAEVGLTTREACANTVRNVTACHLAGVCQGEVFDVTPYAKTVAYHLLRNPLNQSMPRKFKIAFSGCAHDCALTPIHDIGLLAVKRADGAIGFRMVAGGGLGSAPRVAQLLREFTPMAELIPSIEAVIKVFDTLGNRKNRNKARMKFVIDKLGFEEFKRRWEAAYVAMGHALPKNGELTLLQHQDVPTPLIMPTRNGLANGNGNDHSKGTHAIGLETPFEMWQRTNVVKQKQEGYVTAAIKLFMGDITVDQMFFVADLAERYSNGNLRTTINQNMVIRWIPADLAPKLYEDLASRGLADPGAELVEDIIACPGTDTCGLGITSYFNEIVPTNARTGDNVDVLLKVVEGMLPAGEHRFPSDQVTNHSERFLVAELIREKLIRGLGEELPYSVSVVIDAYRDSGDTVEIDAEIWVEREGQKGIVIGAKGERLKSIASAARKDIEALLQRRVYLQSWVKTKRKWSDDLNALRTLNIGSED